MHALYDFNQTYKNYYSTSGLSTCKNSKLAQSALHNGFVLTVIHPATEMNNLEGHFKVYLKLPVIITHANYTGSEVSSFN